MKVIKPLRLGILTKPFEKDLEHFLSIAIIAYFPFDEPDRLLPEVALWKLAAEVLGSEGVVDEIMPKVAPELLVAGAAFPRNGPQPRCTARVRLGSIDRSFAVTGDRVWKGGAPTEPVPFSSMPLSWSSAFGGEGFPHNPLGRGFPAEDGAALPNVEDPRHLVRSRGDRPPPASPMSVSIAWPQRTSLSGTYDQRWLDERYPGFPVDFDWSFFNVAQPEQRLAGPLSGGEPFILENLHPTEGTIQSRLPRGQGRCLVVQKVDGREVMRDVRTKIDTVWLFPNQQRGAVIHRGVLRVAEDDAADVLYAVAALECDEERPLAHYERALADRLDKKKALGAVLRDSDLTPPQSPRSGHGDDALSDMDELMKMDFPLADHARRGAQRKLDAARERLAPLVAQGLVLPPMVVPERVPPPAIDDLADVLEKAERDAEAAKEKAMAERAAAEARARGICDKLGLSYENVVAEGELAARRKKRIYSAREELENLEARAQLIANIGGDPGPMHAVIRDPKLAAKLHAAEAKINEAYRKTAHFQVPTLHEAELFSRDHAEMAAREGWSYAGRDLTRCDLSGLALRGLDLQGAYLEGANLRGATLDGADLRGALLAHADLSGATLRGARLQDANLGKATIDDADFDGANLERATLWEATIRRTRFDRVQLAFAQLGLATLEDVSLEGARGESIAFLRVAMRRVRLTRAELVRCAFVEATLEDVDFTESRLVDTTFVAITLARARFDRANLDSARFVLGSALPGGSFTWASMRGTNLRGASLVGADFTRAVMERADLSEADLTRARLRGVRAKDARFHKTRLCHADVEEAVFTQAILQKADVTGTSFRRTNLFRADALGMKGDAATSMEGAYVERVRYTPRGRRG